MIAKLRTLIPEDHKVFSLEPGNGTRFECMLIREPGRLHFAIKGKGAGEFNPACMHPGYIAEKLGLQNYMGDAELVTVFIERNLDPLATTQRDIDLFNPPQ